MHAELAGVGQLAGDEQQRQEVALVVGGAAGVEAAVADVGLERRRRPARLVAGVLDVVVAVDQDRRRAVAVGAQLADDERRVIAVLDQLAVPPAASIRRSAQPAASTQRLGVAAGRARPTGSAASRPARAIAVSRSVTRAT